MHALYPCFTLIKIVLKKLRDWSKILHVDLRKKKEFKRVQSSGHLPSFMHVEKTCVVVHLIDLRPFPLTPRKTKFLEELKLNLKDPYA